MVEPSTLKAETRFRELGERVGDSVPGDVGRDDPVSSSVKVGD